MPWAGAGAGRRLTSFLITVAVESLVLAAGFREFRRPRGLLVCFLANLLTHPVYRHVRASLFPHERWLVGMALLEPLVVVCEAVIYAWFLRMPARRAVAASLVANLSSAAVGMAGRLLRP